LHGRIIDEEMFLLEQDASGRYVMEQDASALDGA
jgi:hypothetical protein